jgi:hypothetical protein
MHTPLVSVVILNYNYARFLPRSIESALAQDWPATEVLVVDDASTDDSPQVIAGFGDRIRPVLKPANEGHGAGMNTGFAASRGEIVMFLDADDFLQPQAARRIAEAAQPRFAQYQFRMNLVDADGRTMDVYPPKEIGWDDGDVRDLLLTHGRYSTTVTSGLAFSREALAQILPMDPEAFRQGGDGYLACSAPFYGEVCSFEEVLGAYCQHGGNHSQFAAAVSLRARWRLAHDDARHAAIAEHARRAGCEPAPQLWRRDPHHLEERIASLLLAPDEHPIPKDRRSEIARLGVAATRDLPLSRRRRIIAMTWWLMAGYAPRPVAERAVKWKLLAATRPAIVRKLARSLRRLSGKAHAPPAARRAVAAH